MWNFTFIFSTHHLIVWKFSCFLLFFNVRKKKILDSQGRSLAVYHGCCLFKKTSFSWKRHIKIVEDEMDGNTSCRQRQKSYSWRCKNGPHFSWVMYPFVLKPLWVLEYQVAHGNQNNKIRKSFQLPIFERFKCFISNITNAFLQYRGRKYMGLMYSFGLLFRQCW